MPFAIPYVCRLKVTGACSSAAAVLLITSSIAWADATPAALDGSWTVEFANRQAALTVANGSGTIRYLSRSQGAGKNPCVGRDFPVSVTSAGDTITLAVNASSVLQGCEDTTIEVAVTDGKAPAGKLKDGRPVQFTRQ